MNPSYEQNTARGTYIYTNVNTQILTFTFVKLRVRASDQDLSAMVIKRGTAQLEIKPYTW